MTCRDFAAVIVCVSFVSSISAQNSLAWKFQKGAVFEAERSALQKQTVSLKGKQFKHEHQSLWHVRLEVNDPRGEHFVIRATLTKVEHKLAGVAEAERIDPKLAEKMQGAVFTLNVTRSGRIVRLQGYDDFLKRVAGLDKDRRKAVNATFPESAMQDALADLFGPLPITDLAWQSTTLEPIAEFGKLRATAQYEYVGTQKGREMIPYTIQTKYEPLPKNEKALFQIENATIDVEQGRGAIAFSKAAGHLIEHERRMHLQGKLTIVTMNQKHLLEFASQNEVRIRLKKGD